MNLTGAQQVAANVRVVLAKQNRKRGEVATILSLGPSAASRKVNGRVPFTLPELFTLAGALGLDSPAEFMRDYEAPVRAT